MIHGDFFKRYLGDDIWNRVIDRMREIDPDVEIVFNDYQLLTDDYGQEWSTITLWFKKKTICNKKNIQKTQIIFKFN